MVPAWGDVHASSRGVNVAVAVGGFLRRDRRPGRGMSGPVTATCSSSSSSVRPKPLRSERASFCESTGGDELPEPRIRVRSEHAPEHVGTPLPVAIARAAVTTLRNDVSVPSPRVVRRRAPSARPLADRPAFNASERLSTGPRSASSSTRRVGIFRAPPSSRKRLTPDDDSIAAVDLALEFVALWAISRCG